MFINVLIFLRGGEEEENIKNTGITKRKENRNSHRHILSNHLPLHDDELESTVMFTH